MGNKLFRGVVWSGIERFSVQGLQFLLTILIARLVFPSEYGLIAMVTIFLSIAQAIIDGGFSNALIQRQDRNDLDFCTVFYFNIFIGTLSYAILFFCAPFIGSFYHEERLILITRVVGLNLILESFTIVQRAQYIIELDFKNQALISLVAATISGLIGLILAYLSFGVWAIVIQSLLYNFIGGLLLWIYASWRPRWLFSFSSLRSLFSHGVSLLGIAVINQICANLYYLVMGRFYTSTEVGYFNRAGTFANFPANNVSQTINRALFPILCEQQNDRDKLSETYIKYLRFTIILLFPVIAILFSLAEPFVLVVLGNKWKDSIPVLRILALAYFLTPVMNLMTQVLYATKASLSFKSEITKRFVSIIILYFTMPIGFEAVCWGLVLFSLFDFLISHFFLRKVIAISFFEQLSAMFYALVLSSLVVTSNYFIVSSFRDAWLQLLAGSVISGFLILGGGLALGLKEFEVIKKKLLRR